MVTEMTGSLAFIVPAMVAVVVSYFLVTPKFTIYRRQVRSRADSPAHRGEYNIPIMSTLKVKDAMKTEVITLLPDDTVEHASALMGEKKFRGIPIVSSNGNVIGMVTMSDILRVPSSEVKSTQLSNVMTKNVVIVFPEDSLLVALGKLTAGGIGRLPVISKDSGQVVGILTRSDLFNAYQRY